jgi:hypothetical protein
VQDQAPSVDLYAGRRFMFDNFSVDVLGTARIQTHGETTAQQTRDDAGTYVTLGATGRVSWHGAGAFVPYVALSVEGANVGRARSIEDSLAVSLSVGAAWESP